MTAPTTPRPPPLSDAERQAKRRKRLVAALTELREIAHARGLALVQITQAKTAKEARDIALRALGSTDAPSATDKA